MRPCRIACLLLALPLALAAGCRAPALRVAAPQPLRFSEIATQGDPARRASLRLCSEGLRSDSEGRAVAAQSRYERAIQIDPTNPWAYLALARHELDTGDGDSALTYLQRAETLLEGEGERSPRVEPHLAGLRGAALRATGRPGETHLERAAALAPEVWGDWRLDADELR